MELSRNKINIVMARKCMTITQLAEAYGCSRNRINILLNSRKVSVLTVGKLAAALGCDVTEIMESEN